jgi:hypothetical protein
LQFLSELFKWSAAQSIRDQARSYQTTQSVRKVILFCRTVVIAGCVLPEPLIDHRGGQPADSGKSISCPIEEVQASKGLPRLSGIAGIATPFVIRDNSSGADRLVRSGESVSFELNAHGMPANAALSLYLETLDSSGRLLDDGTPLSDGSIVRLRDEQGTALVGSDTRKRVALPEASLLVLVKTDVPDPTRPTTCDDQLRDGDFVFLRTLNPSAWLGATEPTSRGTRSA